MARNLELNGLIYSKYSTHSELARELGWTPQRLSKIVTGRRDPYLEEVADLACKLGRSVGDMVNLFLQSKSPNG